MPQNRHSKALACLLWAALAMVVAAPSFAANKKHRRATVRLPVEPLFGPEFTLSHPDILDASRKHYAEEVPVSARRAEFYGNSKLHQFWGQYMVLLRQKLIHRRPLSDQYTNFEREVNQEIRQAFKSSAWPLFFVGVDPGVLEITTRPGTAAQFSQYADEFQDAIFETAKDADLGAFAFLGGGHINMGLQGFRKNRLLLRNFLVDFLNHNELFMGVFGYDTNNALSPLLLPEEQSNFIRMALSSTNLIAASQSFEDIIENYDTALTYNERDPLLELWRRDAHTDLRQRALAFIIRHDPDHPENDRLEIRAVRPQASMDVFVRQIRLLQGRLNFLAKHENAIPVHIQVPLQQGRTLKDLQFNPPVDPQEALRAFHQYVIESGERWEDHQDYLWPEWISSGALDAFNCSLLISGPSSSN